jgi:hypothetical protein
VLLVSVPYALKAVDAETLGGLPPSAFAQARSSLGESSERRVFKFRSAGCRCEHLIQQFDRPLWGAVRSPIHERTEAMFDEMARHLEWLNAIADV